MSLLIGRAAFLMHYDQLLGSFELSVLKVYVVLRDLNLERFLFVLGIRGQFGLKSVETSLSVLDPSSFKQLNVVATSQSHRLGVNRFEVGNTLPFEGLNHIGQLARTVSFLSKVLANVNQLHLKRIKIFVEFVFTDANRGFWLTSMPGKMKDECFRVPIDNALTELGLGFRCLVVSHESMRQNLHGVSSFAPLQLRLC